MKSEKKLPQGITAGDGASLKDASLGKQLEGFQAKTPESLGTPVVLDTAKTTVKKPVARKKASTFSSLKALKPRVSAANVDKTKVILEAKQRKEFLLSVVSEYDQICLKLAEFSSIEDAQSSEAYRALVEEKERIDQVLAEQPQDVQDQFHLNFFIAVIDRTNATSDREVIAVLDETVAMGRGRKTIGNESADLYFYSDDNRKYGLAHILSQMPGCEGKPSKADFRLYSGVKQLIHRYIAVRDKREEKQREAEKEKVEKIRSRSGADPRNFSRGVEANYVFYLKPKEVENGRSVGMPGAVEVYIYHSKTEEEQGVKNPKLYVGIKDSAGSLKPKWLSENGHWFPLYWFQKYIETGKLPDNVPADIRQGMESFFRKFNAAFCAAKKQAWKEGKAGHYKESELVAAGA